jgi:hypothetical protein
MRRPHDTDAVLGDIGEYLVQFDILLRTSANQIVVRHARDGEHWLSVQLGIVETIEQV